MLAFWLFVSAFFGAAGVFIAYELRVEWLALQDRLRRDKERARAWKTMVTRDPAMPATDEWKALVKRAELASERSKKEVA